MWCNEFELGIVVAAVQNKNDLFTHSSYFSGTLHAFVLVLVVTLSIISGSLRQHKHGYNGTCSRK